MLLLTLPTVLHGILGIFGVSDRLDYPLLAALSSGYVALFPIVMLWFLWVVLRSPSLPSSLEF